ncbi:MAG: hypothetical protein IKP86_14050, partial [Anaerolineaceae bacterium]|nr:hypothetical protein [Anaerolineaceae bacterium]
EENKENCIIEKPQDHLVSTKHCVTINGKEIRYTATVGTMVVSQESNKDGVYEGEKPRFEIFFTAYTLDEPGDISARPLTFSFNGGPGSSSIWVHMGFLGPRRVSLDDEGNVVKFPAPVIDNEYSILDLTDLVFIDPVMTGYSRSIPGNKDSDFFGYTKDIKSVGDFIRLYVSRYERWSSPKYLAGESYGTPRSVGLAKYLSEEYSLYLNGLMLISTANDFSTLEFTSGNELPFVLHLPTYAADAWYYKKLSPEYQAMNIEDFLREVREFAGGEYLTALFKGSRLSESEREHIADKLSAYTGLKKQYVLLSNLRIEISAFCKELLRDEHLVVGRIDSRYTGTDRNNVGGSFEDDPSGYQLVGAFGGVINDYLNRELGFKSDRPYRTSSDLWKEWNYSENSFLQQQDIIRDDMAKNKDLKIWVICGYFDLATPFFAAEWVYDHIFLEPEYQKNLSFTYYESGHMIYLHKPSLIKFRKDAENWYGLLNNH